ncbi:MAG: DUF2809 domain-containing protein [Acidobacteriota bacterium]
MIERPIERNRIIYSILIIVVIILGLGSRKFSMLLPSFIGEYAGDSLYALTAYFIFGYIKPKYPVLKVGLLALIYSYFIEISQLYHSQWIDSIRHTKLGGLILGYGFLWSDIICYTVGVVIAIIFETILYKTKAIGAPKS